MSRYTIRRGLHALVLSGWVTAIAVESQAQEAWVVGQGGQSWATSAEVMAGVAEGADGGLRPVNFVLDDNVIRSITWIDARTEDFISESSGRVWDNAAKEGSPAIIVDGDSTTTTGDRFKDFGIDQTGRIFFLDLGASFPASQITFFPSPEGRDDFIRSFDLSINDGRVYNSSGSPVYQSLRLVEQNRESRVDVRFPDQLLRFIKLTVRAPNPFEIAELEVHGEGFVPRSSYLSQLIELPDLVNFGQLTFKATPIGSETEGASGAIVTVEMRNGSDDTPLEYYRVFDLETGAEEVVTQDEFESTQVENRGSIRPDLTNWSPWTEPIVADVDSIYSVALDLPGPRSFFQYRLGFEGTTSNAMQVDSLVITNSPPLATQAVAELSLLDDPNPAFGTPSVRAGEETTFTYDVRVDMGDPPSSGFDGLRIETSAEARFVRLQMGNDLVEVEPDSVREEVDHLLVYFPSNRISQGRDERLRVTFNTRLFLFSTIFSGQLLDSQGSLPQALAEGDATGEVGTNSLLVVFEVSEDLVQNFEVDPPVITPNGDGVNDEVAFTYVLIHLVQAVDTQVTVYDLSGRLVRDLVSEPVSAGRYTPLWDGNDNAGKLVPPGVYLARVNVATATGDISRARLVQVAY